MPAKRDARGALPNLVVIGAMKCGTSSLYRYLDLHPEIAMGVMKEPNFFLDGVSWGTWDRGVDWYRRQFEPGAPVRGEASVNYTNLPHSAPVAERMERVLGRPKLIFLVRDPIQRSISHYMHARSAGRERRGIESALADSESRYVRRSLYATELRPFVDRFGMEAIRVETQDDLLTDREATMRRIFAFLGVDPDFTSSGFERLWEVSAGKGSHFTLAYRLSRRFGGRDRWSRVPTGARWIAERVVVRPGATVAERPSVSSGLRRQLAERYRPQVEELRELTGLGFERWEL